MTNLYGSSLESNPDPGTPGYNVPTHIPFEQRDQPSNLADLAKMMYNVNSPLVKKSYTDADLDSGDESNDDEYHITDEDSENLISDEEDDKESGFLSQFWDCFNY